MENVGFLAILICFLLAGAISRRIRGTIITLPMVYTFFGIILGGLVLDIIPLTLEDGVIELIAEITLVIILATDASRIKVENLLRDHNLPTRLLGIGLPLTMLAGAVAAVLLFSELSFWEAVVLGVVLAPTDASLGQSVVSNKLVPARIRQSLNIESGLNDGIAVPFLLLALSIASSEALFETPFHFLADLGLQVILGILAGVAVGYLGGKFLQLGQKIGWISRVYQKISALVLILIAYSIAELIGGNGFIAAFVFGITFSRIELEEYDDLHEYIEVEIAILMLLTYLLFGAVMLPPAILAFSPDLLLYAGLSLTLVRMIPVWISLIGTKLNPMTTIFLGWFGPRGIASILYIFIVLEERSLPGLDIIYAAAMITVFFSILAHGITAAPGANTYGKRIARMGEEDKVLVERKAVPEIPLRGSSDQVQVTEIH
jgi:NhaP-type Na+/H+ or K+/H+ antiporter